MRQIHYGQNVPEKLRGSAKDKIIDLCKEEAGKGQQTKSIHTESVPGRFRAEIEPRLIYLLDEEREGEGKKVRKTSKHEMPNGSGEGIKKHVTSTQLATL